MASHPNPPPATIALRVASDGLTPATLATRQLSISGTPRRVRPLSAARDAGQAASTLHVQADEVVRVEYENGLVMWVRADDLLRERGRKNAQRGDGEASWEIDASARIGACRDDLQPGSERGLVSLGIKALDFIGIDLAGATARSIGLTFEQRQLGNAPGLYRVALQPQLAMSAVADGPASMHSDAPVLLFLHGTMSSFAGSYAALAATGATAASAADEGSRAAAALRQQIAQRYGAEVYAWEHRTLSESPIRNALELVKQLPVGAQLHLVSHSRGGLVGELLTLGQRARSGDDPLNTALLDQLFAQDGTAAEQLGLGALIGEAAKLRSGGYQEDRRLLGELLALLDERRIRVLRFARVACPARGTTLASGRLDRWLSVLDMLLGKLVPGGLFGDAMDFLLAVVKERTDPRTLPGLEAMMPGSALTRLLQTPGLTTNADLSVIAGDIEARGLLGQLKLLAIDWFYAAEHDLVVNTASMLGGIARPAGGARYRRDQGEQVSHFNYFRNKLSIDWLAAALARPDGSDAGFLPIDAARAPETPSWWKAVRASRTASTPRPIAIVVPGTMGSALKARGDPIWLEYWPLLKGGLGEIGIEAGDVEAVDLLGDFYGPLLEHLTRSHRVEILPYDWRLSVREAALRLTAKLEALLPDAERSHQPVHIVAHSMGGLVARAMIADGGAGTQAWRRLCALPASRLLMLGTPNRGSHEAVRWLTGHNPTQAKLILLDLTRGADGVIDIVRRFPGLAELLPWDQEPNPWAQSATWKALRKEINASWPPIEDAVLRQAAATWKLLRDAAIDPEHMIYVAGCQSATVVGHEVVDEGWGFNRKKLRWIANGEGDGTVPWASGRLKDVRTFYAPDTGHDQLCSNADDRRIFRGYVDLLLSGNTDQLASTPPARARAAAERFVLPELPVFDELPDAAALRGLGFGGTRARMRAAGAPPQSARLRVSLRHGDLRYARHPVLVGHYQDDTIVSAEASLDQRLRGRQAVGPLTRKRELGLYPGAPGSHAVFFNEIAGRSPSGALVVGLGQVGELSPGRLEAGVRDLLLDYALQLLQRDALAGAPRQRDKGGRISASLSSLLVGTGAGSLSPQESMEAVLRGALAANRKLEDAHLDQQVLIASVEFVELFQDLAIGAAKDLTRLLASAELGPKLDWPCPVVEEGEGGLQRSRFDADQSWWQRIEITEDRKADRLRFVVTGDRARAEAILAFGQLRLADGFIAQACGSASNSSEVSKTLFEMLLPNRLKESAPDQRAMVLLLDEASARFPWELLEDRWSHLGRPPAVVSGMVRQLKTEQFRAQPNYAYQNSVFVVGNPDLGGWDGFVDLPGARQEAEQVRQLFARGGYDVSASIDANASSILSGLHGRPLRVLHLAGHGEHEFEIAPEAAAADAAGTKYSGMVIGKGVFLTPGDVEQMRYVPELVFVNCCKLGKTGGTLGGQNLLAANLGVSFIRMGVRAVICAGWAVDDAAALSFAQVFYGAMLAGKTFGQAVLEARRAAWERHPDANTWGAYQCYGDPGYRLVREDGETERAAKPAFCSAAELVLELRNRAEDTRMQSKEKDCDEAALQAQLRARIDALLKRIPAQDQPDCRSDDWLARADVCAALGFAYGEGKLFEDALVWLDKALASDRGDCPLRAAEQAANYRVRLAAFEWLALRQRAGALQGLQPQRRAIAKRIEQALRELDLIPARASSPERLKLMGAACKRLAWVQIERGRGAALLQMATYYRQAFDARPDAYAFCNWALACLLLEADDPAYARGDWHAALDTQCEQQASAASARHEASPSFWGECGLGDLLVVQLLLAARDGERCAVLAQAATARYEAALARGASLREAATIQEHLDFLIELTGGRRAPWDLAVHEALQTIRRAV